MREGQGRRPRQGPRVDRGHSFRGMVSLSVTAALCFMGLHFTSPYRYGSLVHVTARG